MRRSVRYGLSAVVGIGALAVTLAFDRDTVGLLPFVPFLYGTVTALTLDNVNTLRTMPGDWSPKSARSGAVSVLGRAPAR